jgi:tetratricopeptide (TPR) repeat protein
MTRFFLVAALLILLQGTARAQGAPAPTPSDSLFQLGQTAYDDGNYDGAELAALRGLRLASDLDELGKLKFHLLLGFIYVAREQRQNAMQEFTNVLVVNPAYDLDPVQTSPKILEVFREARNMYLLKVASEPAIYRMPQADVRLAASWRSIVLPGWGQLYKHQDTKGAVIIAAQVLTLAALIAQQSEVNRRKDDYQRLKVNNGSNVESAYSEYRHAYQTRNVVGYVTLSVYLFNYLDALYYPVWHKKK